MAHASKTKEIATTSPGEMTLARIAVQTQLDFELAFFGAILERHTSFVEMLKPHAQNLSIAKRYAEAIQVDRRILQLIPGDAHTHYDMARSFTHLGQHDQALIQLRRACELGYDDFQTLRTDRDLQAIRKDPRFRQILREFER